MIRLLKMNPKKWFGLFMALTIGNISYGQTTEAAAVADKSEFAHFVATQPELALLTAALIVAGLLTLLISVTCLRMLTAIVAFENKSAGKTEVSMWDQLVTKINGKYIPVEEEKSILLDESFDGIAELNNPMPPWLKGTFQGTIVFAVLYLMYYYVFALGDFQLVEYEKELAQAEVDKQAYLAKAAASIDENSTTFALDKSSIEQGKTIYMQNCKSCHGADGEGGVGPNLTDDHWLHVKDFKTLFATIKHGVPSKGMIAWESKLKPIDIQSTARYIVTLQGTNPVNPKASQGEQIYTGEQASAKADSASVKK